MVDGRAVIAAMAYSCLWIGDTNEVVQVLCV